MEEVLEKPVTYVGRLAPSPTGALHLGNARTFMIAYLRARAKGGRLLMRMEDLDHPRDKPGAAREAIEDLRWLGFEWDGETVFQSGRKELYREAIGKLREKGLAYPCTCSRKDVESAQSAPHDGEQLYYPGSCRGKYGSFPPGACWRFRVDGDSRVAFDDAFAGAYAQDVGASLGDFPLARDEGGAGYTLAAVVDDAEMGVREVVRADDLLPATPAQILVQRALGLPTPGYCHIPLVVGEDGRRLAKRHGDTRIARYRAMGAAPGKIIGYLASTCGWAEPGEEISLADLVPRFKLDTIPHEPVVVRFMV